MIRAVGVFAGKKRNSDGAFSDRSKATLYGNFVAASAPNETSETAASAPNETSETSSTSADEPPGYKHYD